VHDKRRASDEGMAEVTDFMPVGRDPREIVRIAKAVRGPLRFRMECRPAFDYAREAHDVTLAGEPESLKLLFSNLWSNALDFAPEGSAITVAASRMTSMARGEQSAPVSRIGRSPIRIQVQTIAPRLLLRGSNENLSRAWANPAIPSMDGRHNKEVGAQSFRRAATLRQS